MWSWVTWPRLGVSKLSVNGRIGNNLDLWTTQSLSQLCNSAVVALISHRLHNPSANGVAQQICTYPNWPLASFVPQAVLSFLWSTFRDRHDSDEYLITHISPICLVFYPPGFLHDNSFVVVRSQLKCHLRKPLLNHLSKIVSLLALCHTTLPYKAHDAYEPNYLVYIFVQSFLFLQKSRDLVCFYTYTPTSWNSAWHVASVWETVYYLH